MPKEKGCAHAERTGITKQMKIDLRIIRFGRCIAHDRSEPLFFFSVTKVKNPVVPIAQVYFVDAPVRVLFWIISCAAPESCGSGISSKLPRNRLR
jgi:hypothetical protein